MRFSFLLGLVVAGLAIPSCRPPAWPVVPGTGDVPGRDGVPLPDDVEISLLAVEETVVDSGFAIPWSVEVIREDEYLVSERFGSLVYLRGGERTVLDGLPASRIYDYPPLWLGGYNDVSLHPGFDENGLVYLAYVDDEYRMAVGRFDFSDRTVRDFEVVFESRNFTLGSRIAWQDENHFFVTQGIAGAPRPEPGAQDFNNDGGKIHRLRADGSIPEDNPVFEGMTGPTSIWTYGHRDQHGLLFDDGALYSNEFGPLGGDELNLIEKGGNYGWPLFSYGVNYDWSPVGSLSEEEARASTVMPLRGWGTEFNMGPSGLLRLSGSTFPEWDGWFVWGALAQHRLIAYDPVSDRTAILMEHAGRIRDVAQLPGGDLLILRDATSLEANDGAVVRLGRVR